MHTNELNDMLREGFSRKFATYWINGIQAEMKQSDLYEPKYAEWAHANGFFASHAYSYGLKPETISDYLSDYDYYKIWPINNWTRLWINDKLTLKYALHGTEFSRLMPEYYFYSDKYGLKALMDNKNNGQSSSDFIGLLKEKGAFACKPNNGTESRGFFKLSYTGGVFTINDNEVPEESIVRFYRENQNYIFTEYLRPSKELEVICPQIHTLRVVSINQHGNDPHIIAIFLRFPNSTSGAANYNVFEEDAKNKYNLYTNINIKTGEYEKSKKVYANRVEITEIHPDSDVRLTGRLPEFEKIKSQVLGIAEYFSSIEYMGFDFGITPDGYKIMEINSHPGINTSQGYQPFFQNDFLRSYFKSKIEQVDKMSEHEKQDRNRILR